MLWLLQDRGKLSYAQLEQTPRWWLERCYAFMGLEGKARAWHAEEARRQAEQDAWRARARGGRA
jgi:hypothetical protein